MKKLLVILTVLTLFACGNGAKEKKDRPLEHRNYHFGYSGLPADSVLVANFSDPRNYQLYPLPGTSGGFDVDATHFRNGNFTLALFAPSENGLTSLLTIDRLPAGALIQLDACYISFNEIFPENFSFNTPENLILTSNYVIKVATDAEGTPALSYCDGIIPADYIPPEVEERSCSLTALYQSGGQDLNPALQLFQAVFVSDPILKQAFGTDGMVFLENLQPNQMLIYDVELEENFGFYLAAIPGWETNRSLILNGATILPGNIADAGGTLRFFSQLNTDCTITAVPPPAPPEPVTVGQVNLTCQFKYYAGMTQPPQIVFSFDNYVTHNMTLTDFSRANFTFNNVPTSASYSLDIFNPCVMVNGSCTGQDMILFTGLVPGAVVECWSNINPNHVQLVEFFGDHLVVNLDQFGQIVVPTCSVAFVYRPTNPIAAPVYLEFGQNIFAASALYNDGSNNWSVVKNVSPGRYEATVWFQQGGALHRALELGRNYGALFINNQQVTTTVTYGSTGTLQNIGDFYTYIYANYIFEITPACGVANVTLADPFLNFGITLSKQ